MQKGLRTPPQKVALINEVIKKCGPLYVMALVPKFSDGLQYTPYFVASTNDEALAKVEELANKFVANTTEPLAEFVEWLEKHEYIVLHSSAVGLLEIEDLSR